MERVCALHGAAQRGPHGRQTSILSCCSLRRLPLRGGSLQIFQVGSGLTRAVTGKPAFQRQLVGCKCSVYLCDCEQMSVSECCEAHSVSQYLRPVSSSLCACRSVFYFVFWCQIVSTSCVLKFWPLLPAVTCRVLGLPVFSYHGGCGSFQQQPAAC